MVKFKNDFIAVELDRLVHGAGVDDLLAISFRQRGQRRRSPTGRFGVG